jgi:hypothetical protein
MTRPHTGRPNPSIFPPFDEDVDHHAVLHDLTQALRDELHGVFGPEYGWRSLDQASDRAFGIIGVDQPKVTPDRRDRGRDARAAVLWELLQDLDRGFLGQLGQ